MLAALLLALSGHCGVERWAVKTMTDAGAGAVQLTPVRATIAQLSMLPPPRRKQRNRRARAERQVVTVEGHLAKVLTESDLDVHVLLVDDQGYTMVVEFPHPACMRSSRVLAQAARARQRLAQIVGSAPVRGQHEVRVTGVLFFDHQHNQTGAARNGIELHPVLDVQLVGAEQEPPEAKAPVPSSPDPAAPAPPAPVDGSPFAGLWDVTVTTQMTTCKGVAPGEERRFIWDIASNAGRLSISTVGSTDQGERDSIEGPYQDANGAQRLVLQAYHPILRYSERLELMGTTSHLEGTVIAGVAQGGPSIAKDVTAACAFVSRLTLQKR
jgi:hypothetical protein